MGDRYLVLMWSLNLFTITMLLHKLLLQCALWCPSDRVLHCCQQNQRRPSSSTVEKFDIGNSILLLQLEWVKNVLDRLLWSLRVDFGGLMIPCWIIKTSNIYRFRFFYYTDGLTAIILTLT